MRNLTSIMLQNNRGFDLLIVNCLNTFLQIGPEKDSFTPAAPSTIVSYVLPKPQLHRNRKSLQIYKSVILGYEMWDANYCDIINKLKDLI